MPELHLDYAFVGDEGQAGKTITMLVARERRTRMTMATAVPSKSTGTFVVERVLAFMKELGIEGQDVIVKTDQEPAIKHLVDEIGRRKAEMGGRWIKENSPVDSHASNGVVERGIQSVQGQVRVMKGALEARWGVKIGSNHAVVPWIMEYASHLLNRFEVGHDGKTAYERCKGKGAKHMGVEFGEGVLWRRRPLGGAMAKMTVLWQEGVFLGVKGRTGEFIIGDAKGVWKTRTLQRTPAGTRWARSNAELVKGVPWKTRDDDDKADGDEMEAIKLDPEEVPADHGRREQFGDIPVPRRVKIGKDDLQMHGYSAKCDGCRAIMAGRPQKPHSEECRRRMERLMRENPKMKKARKRMDDFFDKVGEQQDRRDQEERDKRQKVEGAGQLSLQPGAASSSSSGQLALPQAGQQQPHGAAQLALPGAEKRKSLLSEGENPPPPQRPKIEDKHGTKRGPEEMEELDKMNIEEIETNDDENIQHDEDDEANEWDDKWEEGDYIDQKSGQPLDPALARAARLEEISFMRKIKLYDEVPIEECWERTGKGPTSTRWVDVNKGTSEEPDVRCRLVARDFKPKGEKDREDLFAAMPPLESKKLVFQKAVVENAQRRAKGQDGIKLMFVDVKKAHLYGEVPEGEYVYIELPGEAGKEGKCGRLNKWLYGMRNAASAWEKHYSDTLEEMGFAKSKVAPTVFYNAELRVRCVVHGDDFTFSGGLKELKRIAERLREVYELKVRGILGDGPEDDKEIKILNRTLQWTSEGLKYKADDRHVREIVGYFQLGEESKGLSAAITKEPVEGESDDAEDLSAPLAKEYRALAARANYLSLDRPDIQCATKEVCWDMAKPTGRSMARMKRLARYLLEHPETVIVFSAANDDRGRSVIHVYSDSDWAGCPKTRRSTTGGILTVDGGVVKAWSSMQTTVAQSSGEAEYYAMVRASAEALGLQSIMKDMGWSADIQLWVDSSAAKSMTARIGLGKIRHMEVKFLWLQEAVKNRRIEVKKIPGTLNPADALTKPKSRREVADLLEGLGVHIKQRPPRPLPLPLQRQARGDDRHDYVPYDWCQVREPRLPNP